MSANIPLHSPEQTPASHSLHQQSFAPPRRQPNPQSCPAARPWYQHRRCATWLYHNQARARDVTAQLSSKCGVNLLGTCSAAQEWKYKYNDSGLVLTSWLNRLKQSSLSVKEPAEEQLGAGEWNRKGPRVTPALCDAAKQYTRSRQRAQASGAADVLLLSPAGSGGDGDGRSKEGRREEVVVVQAQRRV
jgi:hypothetical protein